MKRQTRTFETIGEMLDATRRGNVEMPAVVVAMRTAGAFRKPEGVAANAGRRATWAPPRPRKRISRRVCGRPRNKP